LTIAIAKAIERERLGRPCCFCHAVFTAWSTIAIAIAIERERERLVPLIAKWTYSYAVYTAWSPKAIAINGPSLSLSMVMVDHAVFTMQ
jgi:hypothetical protein